MKYQMKQKEIELNENESTTYQTWRHMYAYITKEQMPWITNLSFYLKKVGREQETQSYKN